MRSIEMFTPEFVSSWARSLDLRLTDFVVCKRMAFSGNPSFALGFNKGGTTFPEWVWSDIPLSVIKSSCQEVLYGLQTIKEREDSFEINKHEPIKQLRLLANLGNMVSTGRFAGETLWCADKTQEEIEEENKAGYKVELERTICALLKSNL